jgi:hypothetical protein
MLPLTVTLTVARPASTGCTSSGAAAAIARAARNIGGALALTTSPLPTVTSRRL